MACLEEETVGERSDFEQCCANNVHMPAFTTLRVSHRWEAEQEGRETG